MDIESNLTEKEEEMDFIIEKGIKISKSKRKFDAREMAGSLTGLNFEEPSVIRKKAWKERKPVSYFCKMRY